MFQKHVPVFLRGGSCSSKSERLNPVNEQTHSLWRDLVVHVLVSNKRGLCCPGPRCCGLLGPQGGALSAGSIAPAFLLCPAFAGCLRVPGQVWRVHGAGDGLGPRLDIRLLVRRLRGRLRSAVGRQTHIQPRAQTATCNRRLKPSQSRPHFLVSVAIWMSIKVLHASANGMAPGF